MDEEQRRTCFFHFSILLMHRWNEHYYHLLLVLLFFFIFIFLTLYERYVLTHKKRWVRSSISPLPFWQRHISYVFPPFLFYYRTILLFICFFFVVVVERNNRNRKDRTKYNLQLAGSMQKVKKKGTGEKKKRDVFSEPRAGDELVSGLCAPVVPEVLRLQVTGERERCVVSLPALAYLEEEKKRKRGLGALRRRKKWRRTRFTWKTTPEKSGLSILSSWVFFFFSLLHSYVLSANAPFFFYCSLFFLSFLHFRSANKQKRK